MKKFDHILPLFVVLLLLSACTSGRWVVKDRKAVDRSDSEIIEEKEFLIVSDTLRPEDPTLQLNVFSRITRSYQQKMLVQRNIQDYRLRPGFVALGLAGATAAFYAANSSRFDSGSTQSLTLNVVGALLAASGFINLKPSGEPRAVGEERYLNNTGKLVVTDTVDVRTDVSIPIDFSVTYQGQIIFEDSLANIRGGRIELPLAASFDDLQLSGNDIGSFNLSVHFKDSTYQRTYPVSSVLRPYARIKTEYAELRSTPAIDPENVLADLEKGSQVQIESTSNENWYQVRYGNFQNYISRDEATLIWRSANVSRNEEIITIPRVPFGNVDVESNIPELRPPVTNAQALIITNENYKQSLPERRHTHRDGKLMAEYLKQALGYSEDHIHQLSDVQNTKQVYDKIEQIKAMSNDSTEFFVYAGGVGSIENGEQLYLKSVSLDEDSEVRDIPLRAFLSRVGGVASQKTIVVADIDFSHDFQEDLSENARTSLIRSYASILSKTSRNAALMMSSVIGKSSGLYESSQGEDKKHHIFPYLFAQALQQRRTTLNGIFNYLQQNLSYTSRRLHDRSQSPAIFGNRYYRFLGEK